jgi:hypothetical protein
VCGEGSQKGKVAGMGLGQQEFKTNNKNRIKKEERKKEKTTTKKQEALGADSTRKEKTKSSILEKKKKKKKILCIFFFSKFCGETSRYWALFSKISKLLDLIRMFAFSVLTGFWKL